MHPRYAKRSIARSVLFSTTLVLAFSSLRRGDDDPAANALGEARALLGSGKAGEALARAEEGLEHAPESFDLLEAAALAAEGAGSADKSLWYGDLALAAAGPAPAKTWTKRVEELRARQVVLDPLKGERGLSCLTYANALLELGTSLAKRKRYVCAVELLSRLAETEVADKAEVALAKVYGNDKAVELLLASGVNVPLQAKKKRSPEQVAKEDKKHELWEEAHEVKGKQYTVRTNMGIETAEAISLAMEQMNHFYREVFRVKERGGETARVTLCVYRSRAEFDEHEKDDDGTTLQPGIKGFFSPSESRVCTYDPRSEESPLSQLWSTLFHEASHQFTRIALTGGEFPTWLNEGTASYFEGARLQRNGAVESNLVPDQRLSSLKVLIAAGRPSLSDVVTYMQPGSYPGEYYPFGWGLVYFFLNFENEKSERIYAEAFRAFMATYKSGAKHDVKGRFVEYFVTEVEAPGVTTFEEFEQRWKAWILELHGLHFGLEGVADELIARARGQVANARPEAAIESYRWALRKRPEDVVASQELADLLAAQDRTDAAIAQYRAAVEIVRGMEDPEVKLEGSGELTAAEVARACQLRIEALDKDFAPRMAAADMAFVAACASAAKKYHEASLPLLAVTMLDRARLLHGRSRDLEETRADIVAASHVDPRRWRRVAIPDDLAGWRTNGNWSAAGGVISGRADRPAFALCSVDLPEHYRLEARFEGTGLSKPGDFAALLFGIGDDRMHFFGFQHPGVLVYGTLEDEWDPKKPMGGFKPEMLADFVLAIEVRADEVEFFVQDKACGKVELSSNALLGDIGLVVQGGTAVISDLRSRY